MTHISEWELKSARPRYIRVAAIVIVTAVGIMNICVSRTRDRFVYTITHSRPGRTMLNASNVYDGIKRWFFRLPMR